MFHIHIALQVILLFLKGVLSSFLGMQATSRDEFIVNSNSLLNKLFDQNIFADILHKLNFFKYPTNYIV